MSENSLRQKFVMLKMLTVYITYSYLAFVIYMLWHRVFDDDAAFVVLLMTIPIMLIKVFIEKHIE